MGLANEEQLVCSRCEEEAFDTPGGFIHRDGTPLTDCGDELPVELADIEVAA